MYTLIGCGQIKDQLEDINNICFNKIITPTCSGAFGYIISKEGCKILVEYLKKNGINGAIDYSELYTNCLDMYTINQYMVSTPSVQVHGNNDSDIQFNYDFLSFDDIPTYKIAFTDWWSEEYSGGTFDPHNNLFTNILNDFYNIEVVSPHENPDILFYSVFGNNHNNLKSKRKIFYSGEPISQDKNADFNVTFDCNSVNNCRLPLWVCYLNDDIINDYYNKVNNKIKPPKKSNFCSIICQQDNIENTRSLIVNKLSGYKRVDCGGKFMNNIGCIVPRGVNCSGKIEHNNKYKFVIAFENKNYPGYVTEKICDAYKSKSIPIYWGTPDVVKDFNPKTFINSNDFVSIDELVSYIIKVDNDDNLYNSYFKEPILSSYWINVLNDKNNFFRELVTNIVGRNAITDNSINIVNVRIFNIWHNKLFKHCYDQLDEYSLKKIIMYAVNEKYEKIYEKNDYLNIMAEYKLPYYDNIFQDTNFCQTSCFYHVYKNNLFNDTSHIGFIQYDMELNDNFIYDIEQQLKLYNKTIFFSLLKEVNIQELEPLVSKIIEQYNLYFKTNHTNEILFNKKSQDKLILLHTFVIPTNMYIKLMKWYDHIKDWIYVNCINGTLLLTSNAEITEIIFGLFLFVQIIEDSSIILKELKLTHNWPNLHNQTEFHNYKQVTRHFNLASIVNSNFTDKNTIHSYLDLYENILQSRQFTSKNILEIGIQRGGSIKLWNDYFVNANIYGLDIDKAPDYLNNYPRIKTYQDNAYTFECIQKLIDSNIKFDVIIDDGPHTLDSMIFTLLYYSKLLSPDGILIIEDIPLIEWAYLFEKIAYKYRNNTKIYDLRQNKNTYDDIVFTFTNNNIDNLSFIDYKIEYGTQENKIDITYKVIANSLNKDYIEIPKNDENRAQIYGDPCFGIVKRIYLHDYKSNEKLIIEPYTNFYREFTYNDTINSHITNQNVTVNSDDLCNKKILIYAESQHTLNIISEYINNLKLRYDISVSNEQTIDNYIINLFDKIIFINTIFDKNISKKFPNVEIGILNIDSLTNLWAFNNIIDQIKFMPTIRIYDYNQENIKILKENNILKTQYLEYIYDKNEIDNLINLNKCDKIYDFGIIDYNWGPTGRRKHIIDILKEKGFTVNIATGFDNSRDIELSKCKIILNIHTIQKCHNEKLPVLVFEHLRCNRLLYAGYNVLSEISLINQEFSLKFPNLKFIKFNDFSNITHNHIKDFQFDKYEIDKNKNILPEVWRNIKNEDEFNDFDIESNYIQYNLLKTNKTKKIADCFIFYNELELLEYRLNLLNNIVDYFILVESTKTFSGKDKKLYYQDNKERFNKFQDKIVHIIVDDMPYSENNIKNDEQWLNEHFQRNSISKGINILNLKVHDLIIISDVDEIPDPNTLSELKKTNYEFTMRVLDMDFYYYNLNCKLKQEWLVAKILSYKTYKYLNLSCNDIRCISSFPKISNGGWHLSYFGNNEFIQRKLDAFSHQDLNIPLYNDLDKIQDKIDKCIDLFSRDIDLKFIDIKDNKYLPPMYDIYLKNYYKNS
jgi:beta-1,4-mannosyl-glycoprotein beta-1,4-N-acetylglucosaminyltransferase